MRKGSTRKSWSHQSDQTGVLFMQLTESDRQRIGDYFKIYKKHEPGKFSRVPGWGTADEGRAYVDMTHAFFLKCRDKGAVACKL